MVGPNFRDNSAPDAILGHSENSEQTIEEPYRAGGEQPIVVGVVAPFKDDVVPAADNDEDGKEDVQDKKGFVGEAAEVDVAKDQHGAGEDGGDDAPLPVGLRGLGRVATHTLVLLQQGDAVDDGLNSEDAGNPAVQEDVGRV